MQKIPVAKVLVPFGTGGVAGYLVWLPFPVWNLEAGCLCLWILCLFFYVTGRPGRKKRCLKRLKDRGILQRAGYFCLFLCIGMTTGTLRQPKDPHLPAGKTVAVTGILLEEPRPVPSGIRAEFRIRGIAWGDSLMGKVTKVLVYMENPCPGSVRAGEKLNLVGILYPVRNQGNPGATNYAAILHRSGIWYRFYTSTAPPGKGAAFPYRAPSGMKPWSHLKAASIRQSIKNHWHGGQREVSLLSALCLGERNALPEEVMSSFAVAGGMHLLAVSGLHVGLIWWVLRYVLGGLTRLTGREVYRTLSLVGILWLYAYITGFSTSVCRAVTMFSIFSLGRSLHRRMDPVNGVLLSALLLLMIDPGKILEAGFQLSYAGVLGIVTMFPFLKGLVSSRWHAISWVWKATAAGLSAQMATLPLVIHYFGQFPLYAPVTNLVALPFLSLVILLFVLSLPFIATGYFTGLLNSIQMLVARIMIRCMESIGRLPMPLIRNLELDLNSMFLVLAVVGSLMVLVRNKTRKAGYLLLGFLCLTIGWSAREQYRRNNESVMVVAHFRKGSLITFREGTRADHFAWCRDTLVMRYIESYLEEARNPRKYDSRLFIASVSTSRTGKVASAVPVSEGIWYVGNSQCRGMVISGYFGRPPEWAFRQAGLDFILLRDEPGLPRGWPDGKALADRIIVDGSNREWYLQKPVFQNDNVHLTVNRGAFTKRW